MDGFVVHGLWVLWVQEGFQAGQCFGFGLFEVVVYDYRIESGGECQFVFRPCDATETEAAWYSAVTSEHTPTALVLTRQNLEPMAGSSREALKGGYIIDDCEGTPELILIASGSEVDLAVHAKETLAAEGQKVRVVSMPCMDLFEEQSEEYKESVLPREVRRRVAVEALGSFGWDKYTGLDGKIIAMESFGASAPAGLLFKKFGFTVEHVVEVAKSLK